MRGDFRACWGGGTWFALLSNAVLLVTACSGEPQRTRPGGEGAGAASGVVHDEGPPVVNPLPDCVPVGDAGIERDACANVRITIDPTVAGPVCAPGGFTVEPLQVPDLSEGSFDSSTAALPEHDSAKWDRSALPTGAYVVRLHGLHASCYPGGGVFFVGACGDDSELPVIPPSFYEQHCGQAGGCSTAEKHPLGASIEYDGFWWYLNDRGESALDVVVCAPEVHTYAGGGCLSLDARRSCVP